MRGILFSYFCRVETFTKKIKHINTHIIHTIPMSVSLRGLLAETIRNISFSWENVCFPYWSWTKYTSSSLSHVFQFTLSDALKFPFKSPYWIFELRRKVLCFVNFRLLFAPDVRPCTTHMNFFQCNPFNVSLIAFSGVLQLLLYILWVEKVFERSRNQRFDTMWVETRTIVEQQWTSNILFAQHSIRCTSLFFWPPTQRLAVVYVLLLSDLYYVLYVGIFVILHSSRSILHFHFFGNGTERNSTRKYISNDYKTNTNAHYILLHCILLAAHCVQCT